MIHFAAAYSDAPDWDGNAAAVSRMANAFHRVGLAVQKTDIDDRFAIVHAYGIQPGSAGRELVARRGSRVLTGALSLYNSGALSRQSRPNTHGVPTSDLACLLNLGEPDLAATVRHAVGDFALLSYHLDNNTLEMARDHLGHRSISFARAPGRHLISTSVPALLASQDISRDLDERVLAAYLAIGLPFGSTSFYRAITCLPPATVLRLGDGVKPSPSRYWHPETVSMWTGASEKDVDEAVRSVTTQAVLSRVEGASKIGVQLSGGLDSSLVAAILLNARPDETIISASTALPSSHEGPEQDERRYVERLAHRYPHLSHTFDDGHSFSVLDGAADNDDWLGAPCCLHDYFAGKSLLKQFRKQGVDVCLTGYGGDQFLSIDGEGYLAETFMTARSGAFLRELNRLHRIHEASSADLLYSDLLAAVAPRRFASLWRRRRGRHLFHHSALRDSFVKNRDLEAYANSFGYERYIERPRSMRAVHLGHLSGIEEWPRDGIEGRIGMMHGIEMRSPLLDHRLIETVLSIPSRFKVSSTEGRCLVRRSFADLLPEPILRRPDKGSPFPDIKRRLAAEVPYLRRRFAAFSRNELWSSLVDDRKLDQALVTLQDETDWDISFSALQCVIRPYFLGEFLARHMS